MLQNGHHPPPAKISILAEERSKAGPWVVSDVGAWAQIDAISGRDQPEIELGVLVVRERFVISSDRAKRLYVHQGVMAVIDKSPLRQLAMGRPSVAQPGILRRGSCLLETRHARCGHAYNDRFGPGHFLRSQQCFTKAGGITGMRINPDYEGSQVTILLNGSVDPATLYLSRIVEKNNSAILPGTLLNDLYRSIGTPTIRNDDLSNYALRFRREMINNALNVAFLVQARNDDDGRRRRARKLI
jgi:hypothetical protein